MCRPSSGGGRHGVFRAARPRFAGSARLTGDEPEARVGRLFCVQEPLHVLGERRAVLEAVTGAAAQEPDVLVLGVRRDQEVEVGSQ